MPLSPPHCGCPSTWAAPAGAWTQPAAQEPGPSHGPQPSSTWLTTTFTLLQVQSPELHQTPRRCSSATIICTAKGHRASSHVAQFQNTLRLVSSLIPRNQQEGSVSNQAAIKPGLSFTCFCLSLLRHLEGMKKNIINKEQRQEDSTLKFEMGTEGQI